LVVNRVLLHHFGRRLCHDTDDFGNQSSPRAIRSFAGLPGAPLLWETAGRSRNCNKLILLSATYQQSSKETIRLTRTGTPTTACFWRANVRRLEFEPLRDSILYIGGNLDLAVGGHPVDLSEGTHKSQKALRRLP